MTRLDDTRQHELRGAIIMLFNDIGGGDQALASAITATVAPRVAKWLDEAKADAWDEGYAACSERIVLGGRHPDNPHRPLTAPPWKAQP